MKYLKDSVGTRFTKKVPVASPVKTLAEVQESIRKGMKDIETINYIYVLDDAQKLIGLFSLKDIFRFPGNTPVGKICQTEGLVSIRPGMSQERAAYLALKHNIKAVPVTNENDVFIGVIPSDQILQILYKEVHKDFLQLAGVHHGHPSFDSILDISIWKSLRHRLPWLLLGLFGGMFTARIVGFFETTLERNIILAAFIPLIVYMSDAVGTQMEAFIIRDLSLNQKLPFLRYLLKQFLVILAIALLFGFLIFLAGNIFYNESGISVVLGISLFLSVISSVFTGLVIPYVFSRLKMDPANASGPVATIIQDLLSIVIYFGVATALLR